MGTTLWYRHSRFKMKPGPTGCCYRLVSVSAGSDVPGSRALGHHTADIRSADYAGDTPVIYSKRTLVLVNVMQGLY